MRYRRWGGCARLGDVVTAQVIERAPLPMTGQAPDYRDGTPADAVRHTGRGYLERLEGRVDVSRIGLAGVGGRWRRARSQQAGGSVEAWRTASRPRWPI